MTRQQHEGRVESANERGIKVNGEWLNVSKFHPVTLPPRGALVRLETDNLGYIRKVEVLEPPPPTNGTAGVSRTSAEPQRNATISRLAVLKAAASFAASRQDIRSSDVLKIAQAWLVWVQEEE